MRTLLAGVFSSPEDRPTARVMLSRLNEGDARSPARLTTTPDWTPDAGVSMPCEPASVRGVATEADVRDGDGPGGPEG